MGTVIAAYLDSEKFRQLAPSTQRGYRRMLALAQHPKALGSLSVDDICTADVQDFLDGLSDVPGAQMLASTALKAAEKWALKRRGMLARPVVYGTEVLGCTGGHIPWTDYECTVAEANCVPHLSRVVTLAANLGQRGSDLIRMAWGDIETHRGRPGINVITQKTKTKLWIPFPQELITRMEGWERQPGPILRKPDGEPFGNRQQLTDHWGRERTRLQMPEHLHLHGLRGTAVVRLKRAGATIPDISAMVGMTEKMVAHYTRLSAQRENALAAVERLDAQVLPFKNTRRTGGD